MQEERGGLRPPYNGARQNPENDPQLGPMTRRVRQLPYL